MQACLCQISKPIHSLFLCKDGLSNHLNTTERWQICSRRSQRRDFYSGAGVSESRSPGVELTAMAPLCPTGPLKAAWGMAGSGAAADRGGVLCEARRGDGRSVTRGHWRSSPPAAPLLRALWKTVLLPPASQALSGETGFNLAVVRANARAVCQD